MKRRCYGWPKTLTLDKRGDDMITDKQWDAVLAKNLIARHCQNDPYVIERLKEIEAYTGTANLPSVNSDMRTI